MFEGVLARKISGTIDDELGLFMAIFWVDPVRILTATINNANQGPSEILLRSIGTSHRIGVRSNSNINTVHVPLA